MVGCQPNKPPISLVSLVVNPRAGEPHGRTSFGQVFDYEHPPSLKLWRAGLPSLCELRRDRPSTNEDTTPQDPRPRTRDSFPKSEPK